MAERDQPTSTNGSANGHGTAVVTDNLQVLLADENPVQDGLPPHSKQAEEAVLGSVLKRGLAIADVLPFLKPQHFYHPRNSYVYAAMAALFERAAAIDYHTITEELTRQGTYEKPARCCTCPS